MRRSPRTLSCATLAWAWAWAGLASAQTVLDEPFATPESLASWTESVGATTGLGPTSTVTWDDGAVRFEGDAQTGTWLALERTLEVGDAEWLRVTGRVRVAEVSPVGAASPYCYLLLRQADSRVPTRVLAGTADFTTVRRRVQLAPGAGDVRLFVFLGMPGRAWFDDVRVEVVDAPAWSVTTTSHYRYLTLPGDAIPEHARAFNDESFALVSAFLGVTPRPEPVTYIHYPDLDTLEEYTGRRGNAHRTGPVIHSIWTTDRHEIVHILADVWGDPPALLAEGLAVYLSGGWQGRPLRDFASDLITTGQWLPPSTLLSSTAFRAQSDLVTYGIAGAYVAWLLAEHGHEAVRVLYGRLENAVVESANREAFEAVLGITPEAADRAVLDWLR